jgi:hypothetical protein
MMKTCGSDGGLGEVVEIDKGPQRQGNQSPPLQPTSIEGSLLPTNSFEKMQTTSFSNPKLSFNI